MQLPPLRALVVNDVNLARWALRQALTSAGFAVTVAEATEVALTAIAHLDTLDVVVVSLSLGPESVDRLMDHVNVRWPQAAVILLATDVDPRVPVPTTNPATVLNTPFSMDDVVAATGRLVPAGGGQSTEAVASPLARPNDHEADTVR